MLQHSFGNISVSYLTELLLYSTNIIDFDDNSI